MPHPTPATQHKNPQRLKCRIHSDEKIYLGRLSVAAISWATCRARTRSPGPSEMAATRACPPPPYFSHSEARFTSAEASFQGLVPTETLARSGEELTPTEYSASGNKKYGTNLL